MFWLIYKLGNVRHKNFHALIVQEIFQDYCVISRAPLSSLFRSRDVSDSHSGSESVRQPPSVYPRTLLREHYTFDLRDRPRDRVDLL